ncbi:MULTISPECIES: thiamine phosphate synthase [unclassified Mesorhizobium]|uniref:thiamine phosphate synthase n=1 Tax=unclassified Mesorhizobium TaxID=325217 RepID=UPI000FDB1321|nr:MULTISPECIES: thiamine phosphate synthase [unclassified Mesorhizobium]TGQ32504.1 thiamine phosphate synthase [Mesorhizobium sp. M00.F.Ca.ET.216.01.1.1]TIS53553.1 MAG: thiamine phosphate synthase [Mesorhizobium sp.]TJW03678.1 MAG: thiamine phosphate synthase [Mesorhizobium sp.]
MKLDPFYLIVDSAAWIERLVPLGVRLVQLRIKTMDEAGLRAEIRKAKALCAQHKCQFIVNDHWRLAIEEGCDFVHLGQEDLQTADLARIRAAGLRLGLSTHDHAELQTAITAEPNYIALGPIYPTILKKMKWAPQGLERISEWKWKRRVAPIPLVAIGGLNPDRLNGVFAAGADSAAVVTDITLNADPEAQTRQWIEKTEQWR